MTKFCVCCVIRRYSFCFKSMSEDVDFHAITSRSGRLRCRRVVLLFLVGIHACSVVHFGHLVALSDLMKAELRLRHFLFCFCSLGLVHIGCVVCFDWFVLAVFNGRGDMVHRLRMRQRDYGRALCSIGLGKRMRVSLHGYSFCFKPMSKDVDFHAITLRSGQLWCRCVVLLRLIGINGC